MPLDPAATRDAAPSPGWVIALLQVSTLASAWAAYWYFPAALHGISGIVADVSAARGPGGGTLVAVFLLYGLFGVIWTAPYWLAPLLAFLLPLLGLIPLLRRDPVRAHATLRQFVAPPIHHPAASRAEIDAEQGRHASAVFFVSLIWPVLFVGVTKLLGKGPWLGVGIGWWWLCLCFYLVVLVILAILTLEALARSAARRAAARTG